MVKRRLSPEQAQENISRKELGKLLERHGWVTTDVVPDLGEDLLVRIYDSGVFTGISCYIQLKSTQNIEGLRLRSGEVSYAFEVDDLKHWEGHGVPVLLIIWDVNREQGYYQWINEAISQLSNRRGRSWRLQKEVNLHFPSNHNFDESALKDLRRELAVHYQDAVAKGKELIIKAEFKFPTTGERSEKLAEFQRFLDTGDAVELDSSFISKFKFSDWWTKLHGDMEIAQLKMGPAQYDETRPFQIRFHSKQSETVVLPYVELRMEKAGEREATFSNMHQNTYYLVRLVINRVTNEFRLLVTLKFNGIDGYEAKEALKIMRFMSEGCTVFIRNLEIKEELSTLIPEHPDNAPPQSAIDFVDKVCRIQDEIHMLFTFQEGGEFSTKDEEVVDKLLTIFHTGRFQYTSDISIEIAKPAIELFVPVLEQHLPLNLRAIWDDVSVILLGKEVSLGPTTVYIEGMWEAPVDEVKSWLETAIDEDVYKVNLPQAEITQVYERWASYYPNKMPDNPSEIVVVNRQEEALPQLRELAREVQGQNQGLSEDEAARIADELTREAIDSLAAQGKVRFDCLFD